MNHGLRLRAHKDYISFVKKQFREHRHPFLTGKFPDITRRTITFSLTDSQKRHDDTMALGMVRMICSCNRRRVVFLAVAGEIREG